MLLFEEQKVTNPPKAGGYAKILCVSPAYGGNGNSHAFFSRFYIRLLKQSVRIRLTAIGFKPNIAKRFGEMTVRATMNYKFLIILASFISPGLFGTFWPDKKYIIYS